MISTSIERVLELQLEWTAGTSTPMSERRSLVRNSIPTELAAVVEGLSEVSSTYEFVVEGGDGAGKKARIPWVRVFDEARSPNAQSGWYVVLLFSATGDAAYMSLNRGTTEWANGNMKAHPVDRVKQGTLEARSVLEGKLDGLELDIDLGDTGRLAQMYQSANVAAVRYQRGHCPNDESIAADLRRLLCLLEDLYDIEGVESVDERVSSLDPRAFLASADADVLVAYCQENSTDSNPVRFDVRHHIFRVENRNGKVFVLPSSDVADSLAAVWSSERCGVFSAYDEKPLRETITELMPATYVGSLGESQTRAVWEVLRIAGGFVKGLPVADASVVFAEPGDVPVTEVLPDKMETLLHALEEMNLIVSDAFARQCLAAIDAGKHLLLVGPPGTGKTSLALALARYARRMGMSIGQMLVTGTTDWTSNDTLGGYWLHDGGRLRFRPGFILQAVRERRWLIIDEFNRADLDKCLGPFFTVLSGQSAILPYSVEDRGSERLVEILQEEGPSGPSTFRVNASWRLIGTMNTWDRDVLFEMSFALKRRLAVLEVPPLAPADVSSIVASRGGDNANLGAKLADMTFGATRQPLGLGIILDFCAYESRLRSFAPEPEDGTSVLDALLAVVVPQFQHLPPGERVQAIESTCSGLGVGTAGRARMRAALLLRNEESAPAAVDPPPQPESDAGA